MYQEYEILLLGQMLKKLLEKKSLPVMEKYDLRKVELDILSFLSYNSKEDRNNNGDTAKDIMLTKHISKAHISKSIDNLKQRGYIYLTEDEKDHRKIHISLSENGRLVLKEFLQIRNECKELLFRNITGEEREILNRVLQKMMGNVEEQLQ